jgi:hypothetical protein
MRQYSYQQGYSAGQQAGQQTGYEKGRSVGYRQGFGAGKQSGFAAGYNTEAKKANAAVGNAYTAGTNGAFGGYGSWDVGHYYIIQLAPGTGGSKYDIPTRLEMTPGQSYNLCTTSSSICGGPLP